MVVRKMKEKCKDAARLRREKERAEFLELAKLLPLPSSTTSQLDKASIIRLTSSYLRMRSAFPQGLGVNWGNGSSRFAASKFSSSSFNLGDSLDHKSSASLRGHVRELGSLLLQTLDGFVFALHKDGKIMYISETASVHLGLPQIDLTGSSVFEYVHPSDHDDIRKVFELDESDQRVLESDVAPQQPRAELGRSFCMRMKCILPKRNAGLVQSGYKAIHCNGYLKVVRNASNGIVQPEVACRPEDQKWDSCALVAVGYSLLPTASTEVKLMGNSFMFRSDLDLRLFYIEPSVLGLLGFEQVDMVERSLYQFVHVEDLTSLESSHRLLLEKGQVVTRYYRLMRKHSGFVWVQSHATLVNNPRNTPKPQHIVSVCLVIEENHIDRSAIHNELGQKQIRVEQQQQQQQKEIMATVQKPNGYMEPLSSSKVFNDSNMDDQQIYQSSCEPSHQTKQQKTRQERLGINNETSRKVRKLKTCIKSDKTINSQIPDEKITSGLSEADEKSANQKIQYTKTGSCTTSYSHHCTCLPAFGQIAGSSPISISIRRPSDDTCSIVSSVASTSISSVASSSNQSSDVHFSTTASSGCDTYTATQLAGHLFEPAEHPAQLPYDFQANRSSHLYQSHHHQEQQNGDNSSILFHRDAGPEPLWHEATEVGAASQHYLHDEYLQVQEQQANVFQLRSGKTPDWPLGRADAQCSNYHQIMNLDTRQNSGFYHSTDQQLVNVNEITCTFYQDQSPPYLGAGCSDANGYYNQHIQPNIISGSSACYSSNMYSVQ